jgi:hypothetical protein
MVWITVSQSVVRVEIHAIVPGILLDLQNATQSRHGPNRLAPRCHIFEMNGESYRFRESMKAKKAKEHDRTESAE